MSAPRTNQNNSPWSHSPYVLIVLFLLAAMAVALLVPPQILDAADGVASKYRVLVSKLSSFLKGPENPDIVFMGSSLVLMPAVRCDEKAEGKSPCYDSWFYARKVPEYGKADHFQRLLERRMGLGLTVGNLGVASSIMSDQQGLFEAMISHGKKPRLVILGIAPRDFMDNTQPKYMETPTRSFLAELNDNSLLPESLSVEGLTGAYTKVEHRFKKLFAYAKKNFVDVACNVSKHPPAAEYSTGSAATERENKLADLESYKKLYNPPNLEMLKTQSGYLRDMLISAKQQGISVLVVDMPLTKENLAALDPDAYDEYRKAVTKMCSTYGGNYVNMRTLDTFALSDFEDCCHLNTKGGNKFFNDLVMALDGEEALHNYLATVSRDKAANVEIAGREMKKPL